jgi:hypothetical protein
MTHGHHDGGGGGHHHGGGGDHHHGGGGHHHHGGGGHHHHGGGDLIIAPTIGFSHGMNNRRARNRNNRIQDDFYVALGNAPAETAKTQVFRWQP